MPVLGNDATERLDSVSLLWSVALSGVDRHGAWGGEGRDSVLPRSRLGTWTHVMRKARGSLTGVPHPGVHAGADDVCFVPKVCVRVVSFEFLGNTTDGVVNPPPQPSPLPLRSYLAQTNT